jgi:hypothetical protein
MSGKSHISIAAFVSENEQAAIQRAADHIAQALSQAAGAPWTCDCVFSPDLESLRQNKDATIIVHSFLPELEAINDPWPQTDQRLRADYAKLCERGIPVFICTILRHINRDEEPETLEARKLRLRRLNLLAAEISHATGAYVIDLDRMLADIGARRLQTDYRLAGTTAANMAGHFIALTLVRNALDAIVSYEIQDGAAEFLTASRPAIPEVDRVRPAVTVSKNLTAVGRGRRKQIVSHVVHSVEENNVGWLIRQVRQGEIGPAEAFQRLAQAVRRRGIRESVGLIKAGLLKQITRKNGDFPESHGG